MASLALNARKGAQLLVVCALLGGCTKPESTVKYLLGGGAVGAGLGVLGMVATGGCVGCGAAIGGAVGATLGLAFDALENKR